MTMSSSVKEDENLRKRLQKLFQQQVLKQPTAGKGGSYRQLPKNNMTKIRKAKRQEHLHIKENNSKSSRFISKNNKKHLLSQKKSMDARQHNGYMKASEKKNPIKKIESTQGYVSTKRIYLQQKKSLAGKNMDECNAPNNKMKTPIKAANSNVVKNSQKFEKNTTQSAAEIDQSPISKHSILGKNGHKQNKFNKSQEKKGKKRSVSAVKSNSSSFVSKKKQKISKKSSNNINKIPADSNQENDWSSSSLQYNNKNNVKDMNGFVRDGDFDTNYEEYYMNKSFSSQEESVTEIEYSSDDNSESNKPIKKLKENYHYDLYGGYNECFGSDDEFFDSEYDNDTFDDCYSISEGRSYSDINDDDCKDDEDSYNSFIHDDDFFSNCESDMLYDSDEDYKLPDHVVEDLIIHKGTATQRDLKPEDNVSFNSDNEQSQIVELETDRAIKVIYQPQAYEREELLKLNYAEKSSSSATLANSDSEDCPALVPILNDDGFHLYHTNDQIYSEEETEKRMTNEQLVEVYDNDVMYDISMDSEYSEISSDDDDSMLSEDINEKYFTTDYKDDNSDNIDEELWTKKHKADIIDARDCKYETKVTNPNDISNINLNDDIRQIPSFQLYENVDLKTESTILSITIIDNQTNNIDEDVFVKSNEIQKVKKSESEPNLKTTLTQEKEVMDKLEMETEKITEFSSNITKFVGQSLVNYNTKFFNAFDSHLVMVHLKDPFYIYGTLRLTLLAGTVKVYGHNLTLNTEVEIFSPRGCSVIEISSSNEKRNISNENLEEALKTLEKHFALDDLKTIASFYNSETDAVLLLRRNETRKKIVQQFKKFMNENIFPNINNINVDRPLYNSEYLLRCMINTSAQEQKCLRLPEHWSQFNISSKSRVMLTGGKSVGKSTLLRYLINRYVPQQQVVVIDLDIGQPEFFLPQTISCTIVKQPVLGPGFLLNLQPDIAYAVGHTNIALCAHKYIVAVRSLIAHCKAQKEYRELPWLINTMGYNKGFGLELISVIAQELPLTDVIQLQSNKDINNFDSLLEPHVLCSVPKILFSENDGDEETTKEELHYRLHVWQSAVQQESRFHKEWEMSAKDLRFAILLTRLSEALQGHADWLTDVKPLSASLYELRIVNLMNNNSLSTVQDLQKSLEANLVYLCHYEEDIKPLKCLGIAIVRAIDYHLQQLYLVPALPYTQLKDVNCLAIGDMPLPTSLFTNQGPKIKNKTPFVYDTISDNNSKAIKQIYHRPDKFLTGKHKSFE